MGPPKKGINSSTKKRKNAGTYNNRLTFVGKELERTVFVDGSDDDDDDKSDDDREDATTERN